MHNINKLWGKNEIFLTKNRSRIHLNNGFIKYFLPCIMLIFLFNWLSLKKISSVWVERLPKEQIHKTYVLLRYPKNLLKHALFTSKIEIEFCSELKSFCHVTISFLFLMGWEFAINCGIQYQRFTLCIAL